MPAALFTQLIPAAAAMLAIPVAAVILRRANRPASGTWRVLVWLCAAKALRGALHGSAAVAVALRGGGARSYGPGRDLAVVLVGALLGWAAPRLARHDARAAVPCALSAALLLTVCAFDAAADPRMTAGTGASLLEAGLLAWGAWRVRRDAASDPAGSAP